MKQFKIVTFNKIYELYYVEDDNAIYASVEQICRIFNLSKKTILRKIKDKIPNENGKNAPTLHLSCTYLFIPKIGRNIRVYSIEFVLELGSEIDESVTKDLEQWAYALLYKNENSIIIYNNDGNVIEVRVSPEEETVWLTQSQIAELYQTTQQNVSLHINNILENELDIERSHKFFLYRDIEGITRRISLYNLNMILAVGYRVKSDRAIKFRRWASDILSQYIRKGYAVNEARAGVTLENYLNLVNQVFDIDKRLKKVEENEKRFIINDLIIFEGEVFKGLVVVDKIIKSAEKEIILVDPYSDLETLNAIKNRRKEAKLKLITSSKTRLSESDVKRFKTQHGEIEIEVSDNFHDRYIIVDQKDFYRIGTSVNFIGRKLSEISRVEDDDIQEILLNRFKKTYLIFDDLHKK